MKKILVSALFVVMTAAVAKSAPLGPAGASAPNSCFSNPWTFLNTSPDECRLSYGGITLFGNIDGGYGYEQWGVPLGYWAEKPNYGIQKNSGNTHWLWSPNPTSTSVIGVKMEEPIADGWRLIGVVDTGFDPFTMRLVNGPGSLAANNKLKPAYQTSNFDTSRAGQWDNGQAFAGISNKTYGTLTFGRSNSLLQDVLATYDPVASIAFSQLGFSSSYAGFGVNATSRVNTGFTYRVEIQNLRFALQQQVGEFANGNAAAAQSQVQIGADFGALSLDGVYNVNKDAAAFASYAGSALPAGYDPNSIVKATLADTHGFALTARYNYEAFKFYLGYIGSQLQNPSDSYPLGFPTPAPGIFVPRGAVTTNAYNIPRNSQTIWTGARYQIRPNLSLASGVYWETQNDYLPAPAICKGSGGLTNNSKCAGGRYSYSLLADYKVTKRIDLYAGLMVSNVYGGVASGFAHTQNIDPTIGVRVRF